MPSTSSEPIAKWCIDGVLLFVGALLAVVGGLCVGILASRLIVELNLGPPKNACGMASLCLLPAPLAGVISWAVGTAARGALRGMLVGGAAMAVFAVPFGVYVICFGRGDAITRGSTIAVAGTLIGLVAGVLGGGIGHALWYIHERVQRIA